MKKLLATLLVLAPVVAFAEGQDARLLRFPATNGREITFTYAGDLYKVPINGGQAVRLTADQGFEIFPKYSPDGKTIAFTGQYDGNTELYSIPSEGGFPKRLSYSATVERDDIGDRMGPNNILMGWSPDGKSLIFRSRRYSFSGMRANLFTMPSVGGPAVPVPQTEGGFCCYSPDGKYLAVNRSFREFRTWKYYRGGQADEIWINKIGTTELTAITSNDAQDIFPMWIGDDIYFMSDRDHWMNLFVYDMKTKETRKLTNFDRYDCKFPSCFAGEGGWIVFENGGYIYKYSVKDQKCEKVTVTLNSDGLNSRSVYGDASDQIESVSVSPDGKRVLMTARGEIFSVPATKGATYDLMYSPESHEREATWSNDGKRIAWFSDKSGEYQLYVADWDKVGKDVKPATSFKTGYPEDIEWSNDSNEIFFQDEKNNVYRYDVASGALTTIYKSAAGYFSYSFSPDASWMAVSEANESQVSIIYLVDLKTLKVTQLTDRWYPSQSPVFSSDGKYLYFTSDRNFQPQYSQIEWNYSGSFSTSMFIVPLAKDTEDPVKILADEYQPDSKPAPANAKPAAKPAGKPEGKPEGKPAGKPDAAPEKDAASKDYKPAATKVDLEGIQERISTLPIAAGMMRPVAADADGVYYIEMGGFRGMGARGARSQEITVKKFNLKTLKSDDAFTGIPQCVNPVTGKMVINSEKKYYVCDFPAGRKSDPVPTDDMGLSIDRHAEWAQMFNESWRIYRDFFYARNMHGTDWNDLHDKYAALLPYVESRNDLTYIIGEMLAELNVGHAYITSPTEGYPAMKSVSVGVLGGRFEKEGDAFKIVKVFKGAAWDNALRSPLDEAKAKVGEYITEVDGVSLAGKSDIYETLVGKVGKTVALKIASDAKGKNARIVYVKPIENEIQLSYIEWVNRNIAIVDKASNGRIGYIHIPDMGPAGLDMFTKLFYTQLDKEALIIDDRMNGGGNVSPMILERLQREVYRMTQSIYNRAGTTPDAAQYGPKVCLIDKYSASDGDLFPWGFKALGIGPLIGKRTWGGVTGIGGSMPFVDNQDMRTPVHATFSTNGEWIIEGHGVDPDIDIDINPYEDYVGNDAQLNKGIEVLLEKLKDYKPLPKSEPSVFPTRPQK
jgi:tricorn protease